MFEQMLLPTGHTHQGRCALFAFTGEVGVIAIATLMMAYSTVVPRLSETVLPLYLAAPPPPPPAPIVRAPEPARTPVHKFAPKAFISPVILAPQVIPQHALILTDAESLPEMPDIGVIGGVPGGVPGGSLNGLLGAMPLPAPVVQAPPRPAPPPPPPPAPPARVRVGGEVEAARLSHQVMPLYPPLAKNSRIEGVVRLSAVIAPDGTVKDLTVLGGNPLLLQAALDAVKQWTYKPTFLNGVPVEVLTEINVKFTIV